MEKTGESSESCLQRAVELSTEIKKKESDVSDVEKHYNEISGLENPTTLSAKLSALRGKWKEVKIHLREYQLYRHFIVLFQKGVHFVGCNRIQDRSLFS